MKSYDNLYERKRPGKSKYSELYTDSVLKIDPEDIRKRCQRLAGLTDNQIWILVAESYK